MNGKDRENGNLEATTKYVMQINTKTFHFYMNKKHLILKVIFEEGERYSRNMDKLPRPKWDGHLVFSANDTLLE